MGWGTGADTWATPMYYRYTFLFFFVIVAAVVVVLFAFYAPVTLVGGIKICTCLSIRPFVCLSVYPSTRHALWYKKRR